MQCNTYLDAIVSPRKEGRFEGTCARSSEGGRTGRCTKWVVARSMICFCNCENETRLRIQVSKIHRDVRWKVEAEAVMVKRWECKDIRKASSRQRTGDP